MKKWIKYKRKIILIVNTKTIEGWYARKYKSHVLLFYGTSLTINEKSKVLHKVIKTLF